VMGFRSTSFCLYCHAENNEADKMAKSFKQTFSRNIKVHFLGAWYGSFKVRRFFLILSAWHRDTVSSVGIKRGKPLPLIETVDHLCFFRHALALDERRVKFLPECVNWGARSTTMPRKEREKSNLNLKPQGEKVTKSTGEEKIQNRAEWTELRIQNPVSSDNQSPRAKSVKEVWFAGTHSDMYVNTVRWSH
jgi:uncharacterized protein (DUF2235 family)